MEKHRIIMQNKLQMLESWRDAWLMAEELNMHFSSVFTREDTSSLPVPETKFNEPQGEMLGQLVVTPEEVGTTINGSAPMFPGTYVPRYLCSPVPMFPGTYVPRYLCSPNLCSPVPMFPGTYVLRTYVPRYLCSPVPMFPDF